LIHLETHLDLIAGNTVCAELRFDETTIEAQIKNAASSQIPTLDAKVDWTMARMARVATTFFYGFANH
jgi:hypothetical protein